MYIYFDTGQRRNQFPFPHDLIDIIGKDLCGVEIIRPIWFFHAEQKGITVSKLKEFFTEKSIQMLEHDGFIKIEKLENYETTN